MDEKITTRLRSDLIKANKGLIRRANKNFLTNSRPFKKKELIFILVDGGILNFLYKKLDSIFPNKKPSTKIKTIIKQNINNILKLRRSNLSIIKSKY